MRNIAQAALLDVKLPVLPPIEEQRRIVAVLEDHLSRLDAAVAYAQAAARRAAQFPAAQLRVQGEVQDAPRRPLAELLVEGLANGRSVPTQEGGFPVLRLTALGEHRVDLLQRKSGAWSHAEAHPFLVRRGDFFVARGNGSLALVGRGAPVVDEPDDVAFPDTLIRVRADPGCMDLMYLHLLWNSREVRRQVEAVARTTAGIYKVNQKHLEVIQLPVPPVEVQQRLVATLGAGADASRRLAGEAHASIQRASSLRRALLSAAFSGRLTGRSSDLDLAVELAETGAVP